MPPSPGPPSLPASVGGGAAPASGIIAGPHCIFGSVPSGTGSQRPRWPATQDSQTPSQAVLQQTPSTQWSLVHSDFIWQASPLSLRLGASAAGPSVPPSDAPPARTI